MDLDFRAGFDWLDMAWVYLVLAKKGVAQEIINRVARLYSDSFNVLVVNSVPGKIFLQHQGLT